MPPSDFVVLENVQANSKHTTKLHCKHWKRPPSATT